MKTRPRTAVGVGCHHLLPMLPEVPGQARAQPGVYVSPRGEGCQISTSYPARFHSPRFVL